MRGGSKIWKFSLFSPHTLTLISRYSSFCILNHPLIYQICDVMVNISTQDSVHFLIYLLKYNSLSHQTWPIDRYKQRQQFSGIFWITWRTGAKFQVLFDLATCCNYSITNYVKIPLFIFLEKVDKVHLKMVNVDY